MPSQLVKPALQLTMVVTPFTQDTCATLGNTGAFTPQAPQLLVSDKRFTSQPLLAIPSQLAKPGLQLRMLIIPALQLTVPTLGNAAPFAPHAPQLFGSAFRFTSH